MNFSYNNAMNLNKEIEEVVKKHHNSEFKLTLVAEAKEWRQTVALSSKKIHASKAA